MNPHERIILALTVALLALLAWFIGMTVYIVTTTPEPIHRDCVVRGEC